MGELPISIPNDLHKQLRMRLYHRLQVVSGVDDREQGVVSLSDLPTGLTVTHRSPPFQATREGLNPHASGAQPLVVVKGKCQGSMFSDFVSPTPSATKWVLSSLSMGDCLRWSSRTRFKVGQEMPSSFAA